MADGRKGYLTGRVNSTRKSRSRTLEVGLPLRNQRARWSYLPHVHAIPVLDLSPRHASRPKASPAIAAQAQAATSQVGRQARLLIAANTRIPHSLSVRCSMMGMSPEWSTTVQGSDVPGRRVTSMSANSGIRSHGAFSKAI